MIGLEKTSGRKKNLRVSLQTVCLTTSLLAVLHVCRYERDIILQVLRATSHSLKNERPNYAKFRFNPASSDFGIYLPSKSGNI